MRYSNKPFLGIAFFSAALHVGLLGLPIPRRSPNVQAPPAEPLPEAIPVITQMPAVPSQEAAPPLPVLTQPPSSSPAESIAATPTSEPLPAPMPLQPAAPPAPLSEPLPEPVLPEALPEPEPSPEPSAAVEPEEKVAKPEPAVPSLEHGKLLTVGTDFPHLQSAQTGCYGLSSCHQLRDAGSYHRAAETLVEQMQQQGFQVLEKEDIDFPGQRVFSVVMPAQPEETYYLNVFSDGIGSAVYVLSVEILTLSDLQSIGA